MPKAVDIYVLDKKIGAGQFGDVFKGYSKVDGTDVAIKTIRRDRVKGTKYLNFIGKFTELLDNEIQVLKACKNNNIIRLIDIKKTVNNIYLILEFCNEGDLGAYIK
jgi:serine/threonine-protein kinase ULK/ATG1